MQPEQDNVFGPLSLRRRELAPTSPNQYRILTASGEVKQMDAATAYEAFIQSGFISAVKIERVSNLNRTMLDKKEFADEMAFNLQEAFADVAQGQPESPEAMLLHKNPVLSASQLDILMKTLERKEAEKPKPAPEETMPSAPASSAEPVAAPAPTAAVLAEGIVPGPTGLDVHGDGFDEIIPSEQPAKAHAAAKPAESRPQEPGAEPPAAAPARELTEAEVEKLLGGK